MIEKKWEIFFIIKLSFSVIVEEYESNIRFYLFSELFFMILAVIFLFVVSWKLALISSIYFYFFFFFSLPG